ncbi:MAG TPA: glycosyltransferase family protein [Candidatus Methylomirabilis sp.]|nr:glycosyltransferase family protein [Candidatus Methylomirabilis sp.]
MNIVAIIQARMGSNRLPGKVMKDIAGKPMLERVVNRVRRARTLQAVVVATSTKAADDEIAEFCDASRIPVFRGNELDVLDRYYRAAKAYAAEVIVRVTSDCPLIDPEVVDRVVRAYLDRHPDFAWNDIGSSFPRGLDVEVMSIAALERAWSEAADGYQRTHVTPYFHMNPGTFRCLALTEDNDYGSYRWTVDTVEDLEFVRAIYARLGPGEDFGWGEVVALLHEEPLLAAINSAVRQKSMEEG